MSTYELDDELVRQIATTVWSSHVDLQALADQLREQIPIPAPTKVGAVVRVAAVVYGNVVWIRHGPEGSGRREFQWVGLNDPDTSISTEKLGRIVEVLSEGVDL